MTARALLGESIRKADLYDLEQQVQTSVLLYPVTSGELRWEEFLAPMGLSRFFGPADGYWLRAQAACDIEVAQRDLSSELKRIKPWSGAAA